MILFRLWLERAQADVMEPLLWSRLGRHRFTSGAMTQRALAAGFTVRGQTASKAN
jgi:hypothetical protein